MKREIGKNGKNAGIMIVLRLPMTFLIARWLPVLTKVIVRYTNLAFSYGYILRYSLQVHALR